MKKSLLLTAAAFVLAPSSLAAQPASQPQAASAARDQVIAAIDRRFDAYLRETPVPGLVYGIVMDGQLVHVRGLGIQETDQRRPVGPETLFRIASMSKAFTALAILKLRDAGRLRLDDLAEQHVPELRGWRYPTTDSPRIRIRDLLSHAGGFVTDDPWGDRQQVMSEADFTALLAAGVPFTRAPQLSMEYSNFGYALLGRIITNASGRPYKDYIEQEIMRPLGMASTGYEVADSPQERRAIGYRWENDAWLLEPTMRHGTFGAMGGVQTSATDYARWIAFLLSAWPARDGAESGPVRRSTVREMGQGLNFPNLRPRPGLAGGQPCPVPTAYGMGLIAMRDCDLGTVLTHSGGYPGYGSFMMLLPDHGVGLFAFTNGTYSAPAQEVMAAALEMQRAGLFTPRPLPVSRALASAYQVAGEAYRAGSIEPARPMLAMNFLMDRSAELWASDLGNMRRQLGTCTNGTPIRATGALAGQFELSCERGRLQGQILMAPTNPPTIQALRLRAVPSQPAS